MTARDDLMAWIDLEMTGLDPDTCVIVQAAMILTDRQLNEVAQPIELTIWQPPSALESMSPFVRSMHERSGLLQQIPRSEVDVQEAEQQLLEILSRHATYRTARLAGNSVWQDRRFLARYMPAFESYLHYRIVDVSSIKEIAGWWYGARYEKPKEGKHTALFDVRQSIEEMKFLRGAAMK